MKQLIHALFTFLLFAGTTFSAQADSGPSVTIKWQGNAPILKPGLKDARVPTFDYAIINNREGLPYYQLQLSGLSLSGFELRNPVYTSLTAEESKFLPKNKLKATPEIRFSNGTANGLHTSVVRFVPIRVNPQNGQLEKLVQFEYNYTTTQSSLRKKGTNARTYAANSVLSSGEWLKIGVTGSGMYKLDRAMLQSMGLNVDNLDPRHLQLYGNGGGMLPQANATPRADDLVENAILVTGQNDGHFDTNDYVLFYAQGPHTWQADNQNKRLTHSFNIYSDTAFYFITVGAASGKRVAQNTVTGTPTKTITTFTERFFYENDSRNLLLSGREWYGEEFNSYTLSRDFTFPVTNLVPNTNIMLRTSVLGSSPVSTVGSRFTVNLNGAYVGSQDMIGHGGGNYHVAGDPADNIFNPNLSNIPYNGSELRVNLLFDQMGLAETNGFLNFIEINAQRYLNLYGNQTNFRTFENVGQNQISRFQIGNVPSNGETFIWDVTNPTLPTQQNVSFSNNQAFFLAQTDTVKEFTIFSGTNFATPVYFGRVVNQNLHSFNRNGKLDMVIVSNPQFLNQAYRLANHRQQHDKLKVAVVTPQQIYNEFSSGAQDISAIRDFMKLIYDQKINKGTKTADSLIYLLLLGDASYDYKSKFANANQNRTTGNTNFVPVYESRESLSPTDTYSSEDYFGLLDDGEGEWDERGIMNDGLDLGIGRIPAHSASEADVMINKIIDYARADHNGKWRNRITMLSDDEEGNSHQNDAQTVASIFEQDYPVYNVHRVYLDMFKQIAVPNGKRSPDCAAAIDQSIEQGSLIVNYTGHGGETGLAAEQIVTVNQINNWSNYTKPTFLVTATCEFGRYDDPRRNSAAEYAILSPNGGAIGLLTTTRPVFSDKNLNLNRSFASSVLAPINGRMPRLGDMMQKTKNNSLDKGTRNFALLGDPSMRLAYPQEKVTITSVNVQGQTSDTLKALATVTLTGAVTDHQKKTLSNFNGKVQLTVFEKPTLVQTLGDVDGYPTNISVRENVVYDGTVTAKNGLFQCKFIVPKDIAYNYDKGKISTYAYQDELDAHGYDDIIIGGSASNIPIDTIPPTVNLYMDNESFVFGGLTGTNSLLIAHLADSSGINTAGLGIGHEITATLDGSNENVKVLNEFYTSDVDNFQSGTVRYQFKKLTKGPHELRVKAWDNHNNSSEKRIEFVVANTEGLAVEHVLNYPNPFSTNTTFHFDHNRSGEDLDIQIQIFTISGKLIKTLSATSFASKPHISEINWNGRDDFNDILAKGVYIYKLNVRSVRDGSHVSKYEKMVILN